MKTEIKRPAVERRYNHGAVELRSDGEGKPARVHGYAAVFGKRSSNLGWGSFEFYEIIERGAFDDCLNGDVRALFNHDANLILARSKNGEGTLKIGADDVGLWYEFEAPDTNAGRDIVESLKRKDVDQSSFAFHLVKDGERWEETKEGDKTVAVRTIKKVERLYDVSPVTYPAYPDATVALRSLDEFRGDAKPESAPTPDPAVEPVSNFPMRSLWAARLGFH